MDLDEQRPKANNNNNCRNAPDDTVTVRCVEQTTGLHRGAQLSRGERSRLKGDQKQLGAAVQLGLHGLYMDGLI